jgi:sigma-B regulation protein RsbU (phosphoserine phosphatase)
MTERFEQPTLPADRPLHALVVDDDTVMQHLLEALLTAHDYNVSIATSGEEALAYLSLLSPDIILLDVLMPGINGLEVLDFIRAEQRDSAVIMTTAFGSEEMAINALRRGANDYLRKPLEPREFSMVLQRTVEHLLLNRQNQALRQQIDEKRRQLEAELRRAASVQNTLLPNTMPKVEGFEFAARCVPAREVGGDFYDWDEPNNSLLTLCLCDVMGKGMAAALMMATVRAVFRAVVRDSPPAEALRYMMSTLDKDFEASDSFVTLFMVQLNKETETLSYVDAGHGYAFILRADGRVELLEKRGLPLGILLDETYSQEEFSLSKGDALIIYSDGLVDTQPEAELDHQDLANQIRSCRSAQSIVDRLIEFATEQVSEAPDDITVVVVRRS